VLWLKKVREVALRSQEVPVAYHGLPGLLSGGGDTTRQASHGEGHVAALCSVRKKKGGV
jgi:hypothetical protein